MNENQRRAIRIALVGVDEVLCAIEAWADGREAKGVLYSETNDLSLRRRKALRGRVDAARKLLLGARCQFGLKPTEVRASGDIWSRCCAIRDTLSELDAKHMKGYGDLPQECAAYLDGFSSRLVNAVDRVAETVRKEGSW